MRQRMMRWAVAGACALVVPSSARADWGTFQGNARHDGRVAGAYNPSTFSFAWTRTLPSLDGYMSVNPVAIGGGKIFVTRTDYHPSNSPHLYALSASNGTTAWTKTIATGPGAPDAGYMYSINDPAYSNGRVFFANSNHVNDTWLWGFDANTGAQVVKSEILAQWNYFGAPTIVDNVAYLQGGTYGGMYAISTTNGQEQWTNWTLPSNDSWCAAVDAQHAYAYLTLYTPGLYALNRATGTTDWQIDDPGSESFGRAMDGAVVLGSRNNALAMAHGNDGSGGDRLISFNLQTRSIEWVKRFGYAGSYQPTIHNGKIIVNTSEGLDVLSEVTGDLLWSWDAPAGTYTNGAILAADNIAFISSEFATYAIDLQTHTSPWSYPQGGSLALDGNALFITRGDGVITKINVPEPTGIAAVVGVLAIATARRRRVS